MLISDWSSDVCSSDLKPITACPATAPNSASRTSFRLRHSPNASLSGAFDVAPAAFIRWNTGLSSSCNRIQSATERRMIEKMKGSRQPQALKVSESRSEEHTSELQSLMRHTYAVF